MFMRDKGTEKIKGHSYQDIKCFINIFANNSKCFCLDLVMTDRENVYKHHK